MVLRNIYCIVLPLLFATSAFAELSQNEFRPHLTDCATFFGLVSQSNTDRTAQYKSMAFVFSLYAAEVIGPEEIDKELILSKGKISELISRAQSNDDKDAIGAQVSLCMTTLEKAEKIIRPKMSEPSKSMTPELFK
ncbi:hypothetical protein [Oxalicibacterium solurbis]|uniref:Uncharacterized protein n=1 Tax=Oxalicibacterium solurbis TaxID=69280 RepID=A0A8J3AUS3_9BURK|nr:hypothetical protein [Oxalicibacterium solurbis]GGI53302.1 hypothetical protein GCM10011430_04760 [Oxalicibacterium solurbis]